tara:strand:+ start:465 stop:728 length:264 start_codon:yes stop_codon:yes gene_type:complete
MSRDFVVWGKKRQSSYKPKKSGRYKNKDSEQADARIKYCKYCSHCWERESARGGDKVWYYKDFVTYGKQRLMCPKCELDKKEVSKHG